MREMQLKLRDLQESVRSDWDVLMWNNKRERDQLLERKEILRVCFWRERKSFGKVAAFKNKMDYFALPFSLPDNVF